MHVLFYAQRNNNLKNVILNHLGAWHLQGFLINPCDFFNNNFWDIWAEYEAAGMKINTSKYMVRGLQPEKYGVPSLC